MEAFSDGVLAVAITLLVLDLHVDAGLGHRGLAYQLGQRWPSFAAYAVSFLVIGVIWVNHHALFALVGHVDRVLLFQNLLLLMFVTTLPFTTSTLAQFVRGGGSDARWAVALYGASNVGMAVGFTLMLRRMVDHGLLAHPVEPAASRRALRRFGLGIIAYPILTALGIAWPPLMLISIGALSVYYMFEQTHILPPTSTDE